MKLSMEQAQALVTQAIREDMVDEKMHVPMDATLEELDFMKVDLIDLQGRLEKACGGRSVLTAKEKLLVKQHRHEPFMRTTVWDIVRRIVKVHESIPESAAA